MVSSASRRLCARISSLRRRLVPSLRVRRELEDQRLLAREHLLPGRSVRPAAARDQSGLSAVLKAAPPFAQGGARDAATATDDPGIAELLVKADPAQPCLGIHYHLPAAGRWI